MTKTRPGDKYKEENGIWGVSLLVVKSLVERAKNKGYNIIRVYSFFFLKGHWCVNEKIGRRETNNLYLLIDQYRFYISPSHKNKIVVPLLQVQLTTVAPMFWQPTLQLPQPNWCFLLIVHKEIDSHLPGRLCNGDINIRTI